MLKKQVNPNVQDEDGDTALMVASSNGHYEVVKLLLECKADPTIVSNKGHTALSLAKTDKAEMLINNYLKKGNLKQVDDSGFSSFTSASSGYHTLSDIGSIRSTLSSLNSIAKDLKDTINDNQ